MDIDVCLRQLFPLSMTDEEFYSMQTLVRDIMSLCIMLRLRLSRILTILTILTILSSLCRIMLRSTMGLLLPKRIHSRIVVIRID
jgi:hypothetical protein